MTEITPSLLEKKLIFKRFKLVKLIYFSRFSWVYEGKNVIKNVPVAIKIEKKANCNFLESEAYILTNVKGIGIPEIISYGKYGPFKILIEEFLGKTINSLWISGPFKKDPSGQKNKYIKDICLFAMQGLERLKHIHDKNIIHRDIKADNFLIGRKDPDIIYLIDFGLAKKYRSSRTGKHIKFSNIRKLIGSMNYASCNAMKGYEISRRDDLESFGYLLIYLGKGGSIPWIKYFKKKDINIDVKELIILKTKMKITEENLCKGLPDEFIDYMKYVKKLEFEQEPDYKYLYSLFISILSKNETKKNITFFWITTKSNKDKKKLEEKESKKGNLFLNHIKNKSFSVRKSPLNRLYNKIKESLMNKNKLNNYYSINNKDNINNNMENSQKLVDLSHKNLNINLSDVHNYHILNNYVSNTEKDISKLKTDKNINRKITFFKKIRNKNSELFIANLIKSNILKTQKININKKNIYSIKSDNSTYKDEKNKKIYNKMNKINYNNNIYFINKSPSLKINISNNSILNKLNHGKKYKSPENNDSNLNLKKNILYKPMFNNNSMELTYKNEKSFYKRFFPYVIIKKSEL